MEIISYILLFILGVMVASPISWFIAKRIGYAQALLDVANEIEKDPEFMFQMLFGHIMKQVQYEDLPEEEKQFVLEQLGVTSEDSES